ncbi:RDD family protein [Anaerosinus massiliensis]|uniref:RDD family protein n=1 Tax=Massilibacillus massiliensis TaxID=1806837 RepID=UPI000DA61E1C|nr:RDD family protein [Massilibacillus massiliensis]
MADKECEITNKNLAGFGRRLIAGVLDMIFFVVVFIILLFSSLSIIGFVGGILIRLSDIGIRYDEFLSKGSKLADVVEEPLYYFALLLLCISVFSIIEVFLQASPGKKLMRLCIVSMDEKHPKISRIVMRNLLKGISISFLGVGYFVCFFNKQRQAWHDKMMKTRVVYDKNLNSRRSGDE